MCMTLWTVTDNGDFYRPSAATLRLSYSIWTAIVICLFSKKYFIAFKVRLTNLGWIFNHG